MIPVVKLLFSIVCLVVSSLVLGDNFSVQNSIQHDSDCFTQGLLFHKSMLYESCGLYGKSSLRLVDPTSGAVVKTKKVPKEYFAEGLTIVNDEIYMLTWKKKKLLVFDIDTFALKKTIEFASHNGEGWGLTHDKDNNLIVSDGSHKITVYARPTASTTSLVKIKEITVKHRDEPVVHINELEYVNGYLFANIWYQDVILKIDVETGHVVQRFDMTNLYPKAQRVKKADCLNGIAYNTTSDTFLLTGKLWPSYFNVKLESAGGFVSGAGQGNRHNELV